MSTWLTLGAFWALLAYTARDRERRRELLSRTRRAWCLDLSGLFIQGLLVPVLLLVPLHALYGAIVPALRGSLVLSAWLSFGLAFVIVDYLYYWNHRLLHTAVLWPLHCVHHTAEHMDVFVTSRNTLWTSFFIVYLWASSILTYLLVDPGPYLLGAASTAVLDLTRHAPIDLSRHAHLQRWLGQLFILPRDHALHHADGSQSGNYGANFVLWDKLHGTYLEPRPIPARLGIDVPLSLARSLFWPFLPTRFKDLR